MQVGDKSFRILPMTPHEPFFYEHSKAQIDRDISRVIANKNLVKSRHTDPSARIQIVTGLMSQYPDQF
jgi:hypothetical protein